MNTIKLKYGLEDITARVPGLFPYIEFDENHVSTVHLASDSDVGCYGKIVCSLTIPNSVSLDGVIVSGMSYNYRTLMIAYYKYRDEYPSNSFIQFMERGIGKFEITRDNVNSTIQPPLEPVTQEEFDSWFLVPEYEYYANCSRLWNEYTKIGIMCTKYLQMKETTGEVNCELECLVDKYTKMGGDVIRDYYGKLADNSKAIAVEYIGYLSDLSKDFYLNFNLNITSSENDLGILNTFISFFGQKYVDELYTKEENRVVRIVREVDSEDQTHTRSQDTMNESEKYYLEDTCTIEAVRGVDYFLPLLDQEDPSIIIGGDFVIYNDRTYICVKPTMNGEWDSSRFRLISENYSDQTPDYNAYYNPNTGVTPSTELKATTNSQLNGFIGELKYTDESGVVRYPEGGTDWLWYYRIGCIGFSETVTDKFNNIEIQNGEVRKTDLGYDETHLMAYGDIITDIKRNVTYKLYEPGEEIHAGDIYYTYNTSTSEYIEQPPASSDFVVQEGNEFYAKVYDGTITITYVIGAHFIAELLYIDYDDDGNPHYYYGDYKYDSNDPHGVTYVETYLYDVDSEINTMSDEFFKYFVTHDKNEPDRNDTTTDPSVIVSSRYTKGVFRLDMHTSYSEIIVNGNEDILPYIISDYSTSTQLDKDSIVNPLTKFDYLSGVVYKPTVESDVHVSRGNSAAWERHMKLGELKTFDDLETYSNGGFFNLR